MTLATDLAAAYQDMAAIGMGCAVALVPANGGATVTGYGQLLSPGSVILGGAVMTEQPTLRAPAAVLATAREDDVVTVSASPRASDDGNYRVLRAPEAINDGLEVLLQVGRFA